MRLQEQRRKAVTDDAIGRAAVRDRVAPQCARVGDEEREDSGEDGDEKGECAVAQDRPRGTRREQHQREERNGDERELLQKDRQSEQEGRPQESPPRQQREREHEAEQRRRVGRSEPDGARGERIRGEGHAERDS